MRNNNRNIVSRSQALYHKTPALAKVAGHGLLSKRARVAPRNQRLPFVPPEDWHEPREAGSGYKIVVQPPGAGYRHVLSPSEIRERLGQLPAEFTAALEVVQLSRMTKKKQSFPCYGLQWGTSLYLYPIEDCLVEYYHRPPKPSQLIEARMYGGRWVQDSASSWRLIWTEESIKDFYLNNILIHELGHLFDDRNARSVDRERYAEWFALRHGYQATRRLRQPKKQAIRRRHAVKR